MTFDIKIYVKKLSKNEWNRIFSLFDDATIYQTWSYGSVRWNEGKLIHIYAENKGEITCAAQVRVVKIPLIALGIAYISCGPMCIRNGKDFDSNSYSALLRALVDEFAKKRKLLLKIIPFEIDDINNRKTLLFHKNGFSLEKNSNKYKTFILDLKKTEKELLYGQKKQWRKNLRKSEKSHITFIIATDNNTFKKFYSLYNEMHNRKKFYENYNLNDFVNIQNDLTIDCKMKIMICYFDGKPTSGIIWSQIGKTAIILFSATNEIGRSIGRSYFMRWNLVKKLKRDKVEFLDQGGIDKLENKSVYVFKKGFGGKEVEHLGTFLCCKNPLNILGIKIYEIAQKIIARIK